MAYEVQSTEISSRPPVHFFGGMKDYDVHLLQHRPPTEEFMAALESPRFIDDGGATYATYTFNTKYADPSTLPVAVFLPLENGTASRYSVRELSGFAAQLRRPIISIDMLGTGQSDPPSLRRLLFKTSLDSVASTTNRILDKIGIEEVGFVGICIGAAIAARAAEQRGARARSLVTFAMPGFESDLLIRKAEQATRKTPESQADRDGEIKTRHESELHDKPERSLLDISELPPINVNKKRKLLTIGMLGAELSYARPLLNRHVLLQTLADGLPVFSRAEDFARALMLGVFGTEHAPQSLVERRALMQRLPESLDPSTQWHDFAGDPDILTNWRNHAVAVERRNNRYPDSTRLTVVEDAGHRWPLIRTPYAALLAEMAITAHSD